MWNPYKKEDCMETAVGMGEGVLVAFLILVIVGGVIGWLAGLVVKGSSAWSTMSGMRSWTFMYSAE
jgi:hypothetical protein